MAWQQKHPMPPVLQSYWQWLMYFNNAAAIKGEDGLWYWPVDFRVPNTVLMPLLGIKDRRVLLRQRRYLIGMHRVTYQCGVTGRAGVYRLIPFDKGFAPIAIRDTKEDSVTTVWNQSVHSVVPKVSPYININNKYTSLSCNTTTPPPSTSGFNLLPQLTDEERAAIEAQYPQDKLARFEAMWAAREAKQARENGSLKIKNVGTDQVC